MKSDVKIRVNDEDITAIIRDRLLSLRVTDEAGLQSDSIEIQLDDRDSRIAWPRLGAELSVYLGFQDKPLAKMGVFEVDELEHTGPPDTLTIRGKAADNLGSLKAPKTRSWIKITIGDIVKTIAAEHGLTPRVSEHFNTIKIAHIDQTNESDLHFLTRLARQNSAITKLANKRLLFVVEGEATAVSGVSLPIVPLEKGTILQHRATQAARETYNTVIAHWYDAQTAKKNPVAIGEGSPAYTIRHHYPDAEQAKRAARSKLTSLNRGAATLSLTVIGNIAVQAEGKLTLENFREPLGDEWLIKRIEHQLDSSGFMTRIDAQTAN